MYTADQGTSGQGTSDQSTSHFNFYHRLENLEKAYNATVKEGFREMKDELKEELMKNFEKSMSISREDVDNLCSWFQWVIGSFGFALAMKVIFYDNYAEDKVVAKIADSEAKVMEKVDNSITQLRLELKIAEQARLLAKKDKK